MTHPDRKPTILLVEDSEDDAFFFRWTLQKSGIATELRHVTDGTAALDYLGGVRTGTHPRPDVVFLDLKLPSHSGFEILEWIKGQTWEKPLVVVILSGSEHGSDIARANALGASGYLVKPISVEQLRGRVSAGQTGGTSGSGSS